jgi:hypothetical protein
VHSTDKRERRCTDAVARTRRKAQVVSQGLRAPANLHPGPAKNNPRMGLCPPPPSSSSLPLSLPPGNRPVSWGQPGRGLFPPSPSEHTAHRIRVRSLGLARLCAAALRAALRAACVQLRTWRKSPGASPLFSVQIDSLAPQIFPSSPYGCVATNHSGACRAPNCLC